MPEVIAKLAQDGILLVLHTKIAFENNMPTVDPTRGTPIWHKMLKTTDQVEAEKRYTLAYFQLGAWLILTHPVSSYFGHMFWCDLV